MMSSSAIVDPFEINHSETNIRRTKNVWNDWSEEDANIIENYVGTCWPEEFTSITDRLLEKYRDNWASNNDDVLASMKTEELLRAEFIRKEEVKTTKKLEKDLQEQQSLVIQHSYNLLYSQAQSHSYYSSPGRQRRYGGQ